MNFFFYHGCCRFIILALLMMNKLLKLASISYRAIQELLEADKGGNKWETLERCVQTQRNPKQMVVGICQEKIHERHRSLRSLL